jgi:alkylation response protein AidB-like acyl-CoA dehydrogenase
MDLDFSDDQAALRDTLRDFLEKESPPSVVRAAEPLGFDATLWRKAVELGLGAIAVPEDRGGGGGGMIELAITAECLGRYLAPVPLIEAAVTNNLLVSLPQIPDPEAASLVSRAVAGQLLGSLALHPAAGKVARMVPAGAVADLVVVLDGDRLLLLRRPGVGPATPPAVIPNLGAMPVADCEIEDDGALVLARGPAALDAYRAAVAQWQGLTAMALAGLGFRALEIGLDYVMQRRAFGVLIANFQTIQHRLADNVTALDGARLLGLESAWAMDAHLETAGNLATMAFLFASEAAFKTASESLHFHGGYGYTLEYDIQLYFRRAKAWSLIAGDPRPQYVALARRLFQPEGA